MKLFSQGSNNQNNELTPNDVAELLLKLGELQKPLVSASLVKAGDAPIVQALATFDSCINTIQAVVTPAHQEENKQNMGL